MIQKWSKIVVFLFPLLFIFSCNSERDLEIDLEGQEIDLNIKRLEKQFYTINRKNFVEEAKSVEKKYPLFYEAFTRQIIGLPPANFKEHYNKLEKFIYDPYWQEVYLEASGKFKEIDKIEAELEKAFAHLKYYYPKDTLPQVATITKGIDLKYKVASFENRLLLCLDMYLGTDFKYYPSIYPAYIIKEFQPEYLLADVLKNRYITKFPEEDYSGRSMLQRMIYEGKKLLFTEAMAPKMADTLITKYTLKQQKWAEYYQGNIWQVLLDEELIYSSDNQETDRFFVEAPFTNAKGVPQECPPRIGAFIGYQILKQYLAETDEDLISVFENKDAQEILRKSTYKPKTR